jgi:hypothetical protein
MIVLRINLLTSTSHLRSPLVEAAEDELVYTYLWPMLRDNGEISFSNGGPRFDSTLRVGCLRCSIMPPGAFPDIQLNVLRPSFGLGNNVCRFSLDGVQTNLRGTLLPECVAEQQIGTPMILATTSYTYKRKWI